MADAAVATPPKPAEDDNDHTGAIVVGGLVVAGGAAGLLAWLLLRKKTCTGRQVPGANGTCVDCASPEVPNAGHTACVACGTGLVASADGTTCVTPTLGTLKCVSPQVLNAAGTACVNPVQCPGVNILLRADTSGAMYAVDNQGVIHPIPSQAALAACQYCTAASYIVPMADSDLANVLASCGQGSPVGAGSCPVGPPTCTTPADPWLAWWDTAPTDEKEAVSVFWALLNRVPDFSGDSSYPIAVIQAAEASNNGFCNATEYADPGDGIQYVGFRIITDGACEFFDDIDQSVGGPGGGQNNPSWPGCGGSASGDPATWLNAAGARVLGHAWSCNSGQLANWTAGNYCGQGTTGWANAVQIVLIESTEFTERIQGMAGGAQPPWGDEMASGMIAAAYAAEDSRLPSPGVF